LHLDDERGATLAGRQYRYRGATSVEYNRGARRSSPSSDRPLHCAQLSAVIACNLYSSSGGPE
jgi:hypothetical protein